MVYQGSKNKISKYLKPIIENYLRVGTDRVYIEPFVGGANMIDKINCWYKVGADHNKYLITLHKKAQQEQLPLLDISRDKNNKNKKVIEKLFIWNWNGDN